MNGLIAYLDTRRYRGGSDGGNAFRLADDHILPDLPACRFNGRTYPLRLAAPCNGQDAFGCDGPDGAGHGKPGNRHQGHTGLGAATASQSSTDPVVNLQPIGAILRAVMALGTVTKADRRLRESIERLNQVNDQIIASSLDSRMTAIDDAAEQR
jgi:hypothetical protein